MSQATSDATTRYQKARCEDGVARGHFRDHQDLKLSSLGVGTYLGDADDDSDQAYETAIVRAVENGCNVLDTAINYRHQRSERAIGAAIRTLDGVGIPREQVFISTKVGFIPFDGDPPVDPKAYLQAEFLDPGIVNAEDIAAGSHVLAPKYIDCQLEKSLENLGIEAIDLYYLHNPETQLAAGVSREVFLRRMRTAFECLEDAVENRKIGSYGLATWNGLRTGSEARDYLDLSELHSLAVDVAGESAHHFRAVQLPFNLAMNEAFAAPNQNVDGQPLAAIQAADALGLSVFTSASIAQGQLTQGLPEWLATLFRGLRSDAQRAIQFVRSTPGVTTALVGMRQVAHVEENVAVCLVPPVPLEDYLKLFEVDGSEA